MMVRNFLRSYRIACTRRTIVAIIAMVSSIFASASSSGMNAEIDRFMASYTRDLAKRLGSGSRIEYSLPVATNAETRTCSGPLSITPRDQNQSLNHITLLVACGNEWSAYVPIDLDVYRSVVVATKPLANGAVIAADDVELNSVDVSQLAGTYVTTLDEVVGMGVKRPIMPGRAIVSQQLEPPLLIQRGDAVVISAEGSGLAVKMPGTAMTDGRRGEQIRVKNQTSSRVVDARVTAPGQVMVQM